MNPDITWHKNLSILFLSKISHAYSDKHYTEKERDWGTKFIVVILLKHHAEDFSNKATELYVNGK